MQFVTVRAPFKREFRTHFNGGRAFFGVFHCRLEPDPKVERLAAYCQLTVDTREPAALQQFFPSFKEGAMSAIAPDVVPSHRLCCVRAEVTDMRWHPTDTFSDGVYIAGLSFSRELIALAEPLDPLRSEWLTPDVIALANGIVADAAPDRYLVLSDALRDAGCDDPLVHDHLQLCPDHGPSCWVAEMIRHQTRAAGT